MKNDLPDEVVRHTLTPACEAYEYCAEEAMALAKLHWEEMYGDTNCPANSEQMVQVERSGGMAYFTLRDENGKLCGHAAFMLFVSPFYGTKVAIDIAYYILSQYRGAFGMAKLLKFAGKSLREHGFGSIGVSHKTNNNLGPILKRAGFKHSGELYLYADNEEVDS